MNGKPIREDGHQGLLTEQLQAISLGHRDPAPIPSTPLLPGGPY